ncbi:MAG: DNA polymerase IV [Clostridiales bacterium]|nr:DNA polymerase IV [Clostridiales bacterium]
MAHAPSTNRLILHCDCNNFYASCECLEHPELKNVPLAVAGDPQKRTGVVFAKNDLAKKAGVRTTDTVWQARKKCPGLVFVPPRHRYYSEISRKVNQIYLEYTNLVEPASIDESFLDLTGTTAFYGMTPRQLADTIRERVKKEVGITVSVGVSFNKIFAKLGSDYKKPDATTVITPENYHEILFPLPVQDMLFVGKSAAQVLIPRGIDTIGALAHTDPVLLQKWLGKGGEQLWRHANGLDDEPVRPYGERPEIKSVSRGQTFQYNLTSLEEIRAALSPLADEVAANLRRHQMKGSVVQIQIKAPSLRVISRQVTLPHYTFLYREIMDTALDLIKAHWPIDPSGPIRAMTVGVTNLVPAQEAPEQMTLLDDIPFSQTRRERLEKLETAIDSIRQKHGNQSISFGFHPNVSNQEEDE